MVARNMLWVFFSGLDASFLPLMFFFSCLDTRKEAKEDQGVRDAGQLGRVLVKLPCLGRGRQGRRLSRLGIRKTSLAAAAALAEEFVEIGDGLL